MSLNELVAPLPKPWLNIKANSFNAGGQTAQIRNISTTQSIPNTTLTQLTNFNASPALNVGDIVYSAGGFTIGTNGWYQICASAEWDGSAVGVRKLNINRNSTIVFATENTPGDGNVWVQSVGGPVICTAGDVISVLGYQSSGGSLNIGGNGNAVPTKITIYQLS